MKQGTGRAYLEIQRPFELGIEQADKPDPSGGIGQAGPPHGHVVRTRPLIRTWPGEQAAEHPALEEAPPEALRVGVTERDDHLVRSSPPRSSSRARAAQQAVGEGVLRIRPISVRSSIILR